jgi:predicted Zn-dependent protease
MADNRLLCYEYGATVQAELNFADGIVSAIEERAMRRPEVLTLPSGERYEAQNADIIRIQRETLNDHLNRAEAALANAAECGVPLVAVEGARAAYATAVRETDAGNYSLARLTLQELRAKLRHPQRYF